MRKVDDEKELHNGTLLSMVRYAYDKVPFYMDLYQDDQDAIAEGSFDKLPIIDKKRYVSAESTGLSMDYMKEYMNHELIWMRTSGTSGMFSNVFWHPREMRRSLLPLWLLRKKYYGITARNRMCYFYQAGEGDHLYLERGNSLAVARTSLYDGKLEKAYKKILSYNPEWMILQPSIALLLCDCASRFEKPLALRYIEFTGEYLELSVRKKAEEIFQCQTANQYGTKEVNSIAYECPCGNLHILSDNVYVETVVDRNDSRASYVCVTSLQNYAMPLIRYQLEDRGKIYHSKSCSCGYGADILELGSGRADDMVMMKDRTLRHPYMLMEMFQTINNQIGGEILQYQIEQDAVDAFTVRLVLEDKKLLGEISEQIRSAFSRKFGYGVKIQFEIFESVLPMAYCSKNKLAVFQSNLVKDEILQV